MLNYDLTEAGEERRQQLSKLEEIRAEAMRVLDLTKRRLSYSMIDTFLGKSLPRE